MKILNSILGGLLVIGFIFIFILLGYEANKKYSNDSVSVVTKENVSEDYDDYVQKDINKLKSPIILIGKRKSLGCYSIVVRDGNDSIVTYGNLSTFADVIGGSREIGDTIK